VGAYTRAALRRAEKGIQSMAREDNLYELPDELCATILYVTVAASAVRRERITTTAWPLCTMAPYAYPRPRRI